MIISSLLFAVIALTVYGQLIIKARALVHAAEYAGSGSKLPYLFAMFSDFRVISGLVAALIAGACWILTIERLDVGYAYPFMALSFVAVPIGSNLFLGEPLPVAQLSGLVLIIAGVSVSALSR
jgi:multidrug transporter EmrE-like cation transporter